MEREELEQIPWSSLTAQVDGGTDRRWYVLGALVGLVIVAVVGFRLLAGSGQPVPPPVSGPPVAAPAPVDATEAPEGTLVVAEDELRRPTVAGDAVPDAVRIRAEWFVMDYFTIDGSEETARSIREALVANLRPVPLPHDGGQGIASTFVEWARVLEVVDEPDGSFTVTVAYRAIRAADGGFAREPVVAVVLGVREHEGAYLVAALPTPTTMPAILGPARGQP
jgi:hypothetical protein